MFVKHKNGVLSIQYIGLKVLGLLQRQINTQYYDEIIKMKCCVHTRTVYVSIIYFIHV